MTISPVPFKFAGGVKAGGLRLTGLIHPHVPRTCTLFDGHQMEINGGATPGSNTVSLAPIKRSRKRNRIKQTTCMDSRSRSSDNRPEGIIADPGVDFCRGDLPVPQGSLDQIEVPSPPVQPRRKRVPQGASREEVNSLMVPFGSGAVFFHGIVTAIGGHGVFVWN